MSSESAASTKPQVGIGACLVGHAVRYSGDAKKRSHVLEKLAETMDMIPLCPEVAIGLPVPREPIRIVENNEGIYVKDSETQTIEYAQPLRNFANEMTAKHREFAGYVFVKGSPSCGYERVKRYNDEGNALANTGVGVYAQQIMDNDPLLPVEENGRLHDPNLRENFVRRVHAYHEWKQLNKVGDIPTLHQLSQFYSRYKYLVMAHSVTHYKKIGRLLSKPDRENPQQQADHFIELLMTALKCSATRKGYSNALSHIKGYLKRDISSTERISFDQLIDQYRTGEVPLIVPVKLLNHYFNTYPNDYIGQQTFLMDNVIPAKAGI
ncbi:MAG: DUF1722 domain-containing protein [Oceanicoccus sp.]|uniref:DUF523 and DUF1722 domain-containing protein n=1 Tax=Oceanicoccus sp. TaxID=2691044 RepID=UPI00262F8316|nr:DUF1722 domain-containing protein [Oceanicoccus sp.]MDG1772167.1 DUF1722 domain-containing protein [Oceanicoccus sp.]